MSRILERLFGLSMVAAGSTMAIMGGVPAFVVMLVVGSLMMLCDAIKHHKER